MQDNNSIAHSENTTDASAPLRSATATDASHRSAPHIHRINYDGPASAPSDRSKQLYAIIDNVTNEILGGIQIHKNDQSAIRTLYDIATRDTMVNKHPADFDLWLLGAIGTDHRLHENLTRIVTGAQILSIVKAFTENKGDNH